MRTGDGSAPNGRPRRTFEPADVILSSSQAQKLSYVYLDLNFIFGRNNKWKFFFDISRQYKLLIVGLQPVADPGFWIRGVTFKKFGPKPPILCDITVGLHSTLYIK